MTSRNISRDWYCCTRNLREVKQQTGNGSEGHRCFLDFLQDAIESKVLNECKHWDGNPTIVVQVTGCLQRDDRDGFWFATQKVNVRDTTRSSDRNADDSNSRSLEGYYQIKKTYATKVLRQVHADINAPNSTKEMQSCEGCPHGRRWVNVWFQGETLGFIRKSK